MKMGWWSSIFMWKLAMLWPWHFQCPNCKRWPSQILLHNPTLLAMILKWSSKAVPGKQTHVRISKLCLQPDGTSSSATSRWKKLHTVNCHKFGCEDCFLHVVMKIKVDLDMWICLESSDTREKPCSPRNWVRQDSGEWGVATLSEIRLNTFN